MGLEPTTFSLATRRSTTELCPLVLLMLKVLAFFKLSNRQISIIEQNSIYFISGLQSVIFLSTKIFFMGFFTS